MYGLFILAQKLLPDMRQLAQDDFFVPTGRRIEHATLSLSWSERRRTSLLQHWPPNSQDLNPVDYSIWSVLQEKVYHSRITDLEELKTHLIGEWAQRDQSIVDTAIGQWRSRLHA